MKDFITALGLVLVIEGLVWALAPGGMVRMLRAAADAPPEALRVAGAVAVAAGVLVVWLARG